MKIVIKEREFEYISDYPTGWKYSAGDPYKFPVTIGGYPCFIKRFEKKSPEDISGWNLLQRLKGKNEPNLARLHDIANVDENGKDIYYIFFEYLDGITLDKLIPGKTKLNLNRLNDDLFSAFNSLKANGFWFVDFCERNIFLDKSGKFSLVDLDSTYPVEETPDKDMYGSKDYWGLVLDFYKKVLHKNDVKLDQLDSTSFNYLQIPFLLLHIIVYCAGKEKDYTAIRLFDQLPQLLDVVSPEIKEVFLTAYENGRKEPLGDADLVKLKEVIIYKVIKYTPEETVTPVVDEKPAIVFFKADKELVINSEKVTFSWQVINADRLEIFKNKASIKKMPAGQTSLELTEFFDSDKKESLYTLAAYSKTDSIQISPVTIKLGVKKKGKAWLIVTAIIIVAIGVFYFLSNSGRGDIYVIDGNIVEDSVVTVHVKDLVDTSTVKVFVDGHEGKEVSILNNNLVVKVPDIQDTTAQEDVTVTLSVQDNNGTKLYSTPIAYTKHVVVKSIPFSLYELSKMNITGKSLNIAGLYVSVNGTDAAVVAQQFGKLTFTIPEIADTTTGKPVEFVLTNKGDTIFKKKYTIKHDITPLTVYADKANWLGGNLQTDSGITNVIPLTFQDTIAQPTKGFVTLSQQKMEDGIIYNNVMRTHPKWEDQGTIQGVFSQLNRKNTRVFKAKVGFLNDRGFTANRSLDGVQFRVRLHYYVNGKENIQNLYALRKIYDGQLADVAVKIPVQVPDQFSVELVVYAGATSNSDWAAWVDPRIDTKFLYSRYFKVLTPDLFKKTQVEKVQLIVQPLLR